MDFPFVGCVYFNEINTGGQISDQKCMVFMLDRFTNCFSGMIKDSNGKIVGMTDFKETFDWIWI